MAETSFATNAGYGKVTVRERVRKIMSNFLSLGDGVPDEDELALEVADQSEATDLARHVTRCASRYRILRRGQRSQDVRLRRIEFFLVAIFLLALVAKSGFVDGLKALMGM